MYDKDLIFRRYPELTECKEAMYAAFELLKEVDPGEQPAEG